MLLSVAHLSKKKCRVIAPGEPRRALLRRHQLTWTRLLLTRTRNFWSNAAYSTVCSAACLAIEAWCPWKLRPSVAINFDVFRILGDASFRAGIQCRRRRERYGVIIAVGIKGAATCVWRRRQISHPRETSTHERLPRRSRTSSSCECEVLRLTPDVMAGAAVEPLPLVAGQHLRLPALLALYHLCQIRKFLFRCFLLPRQIRIMQQIVTRCFVPSRVPVSPKHPVWRSVRSLMIIHFISICATVRANAENCLWCRN